MTHLSNGIDLVHLTFARKCVTILRTIIGSMDPRGKNTCAEQWACNHWQIGKCFMPPDEYIGVTSIRDTDFNGVISVMLNCKHFDNLMSFSIALMSFGPCLLTKARNIGKAVRHFPSCEVTDSDLNDYLNTLETLLKDSKTLANDSSAQDAVSKLNLIS
ncbi:uncharacterized protein LOC127843274 isoform X2 [Dreissena polymorpha]|uniref:uncharacterized protein LOC127843274 isoform X2 n=1 Tax=Dreissena polymorpha TaxID=45954 RepID=UPI002263E4A0|nr:uncharacterized protein LOC127843274 isoform X2 [Dreissena polymorpha]